MPPLLALSEVGAAFTAFALLIVGLFAGGKGVRVIIDGRRAGSRRTIAYGFCLILLFVVALIVIGRVGENMH